MTFPCKLTRKCGLYFRLLDCLNTSRIDKYYDVSIKKRQIKNTASWNPLSGGSVMSPQSPGEARFRVSRHRTMAVQAAAPQKL